MPQEHVAEQGPNINATPLIDVLLVLLVIMIITLPVASHAVKLNLPQGPPRSDMERPRLIELQVDFDGMLSWNGERVPSLASLESRLRALALSDPLARVSVSADARARYEPVAQLLAATQRARVRNLRIANLPRN
jgi:biopolymer transport protein ExbD